MGYQLFTYEYVLFACTVTKLSPVVLLVAVMAYFKKSRCFFVVGLGLVFIGPAVHLIASTTWLPTYLSTDSTVRGGGLSFPTFMVESWQAIALMGIVLLSCKKEPNCKKGSDQSWWKTLRSPLAIWMVSYVAYMIFRIGLRRLTAFYCLVVFGAVCFYVSKVIDRSDQKKLQFSLSDVAHLFFAIAILLAVFSSYRDSLHVYLTTPVSINNIWNKGFWPNG